MTVLLTGAGGQVGREILRLAPPGTTVVGLDRAALDVTDADAVARALEAHRPDAVIHAAAYTAVDRAQSEPDRAFAVNRDGTAHVAAACASTGARLVAISTDYVFGGRDAPYAPDDAPAPLNVYGASKAAGERAALDAGGTVLRTAWVFSPYPGNFVSTMLRLAADRPELRVVADQWGHPTPAAAVARAALAATARATPQILHVAGGPLTTWHGLATAAVEAAHANGTRPAVSVAPITTAEFGALAPRPLRVALETGPSLAALGLGPIDWRAALSGIVPG